MADKLISRLPGLDAAYEYTCVEYGMPQPYASWGEFMKAYWGTGNSPVVLADNGLLDGYQTDREQRIDRYRKAIKGE